MNFGVFILSIVGRLPNRRLLGRSLGYIVYFLMPKRRQVAYKNLQLTMPDLPFKQHKKIVHRHFMALGEWVMDGLWSLSASPKQLAKLVKVEGEVPSPCILLSPHFLGMDICILMICSGLTCPAFYYYKPQHNHFWDNILKYQRNRFGGEGFPTRSRFSLLHGVRRLRKGHILSYFPDINPGTRKGTAFVSFLGVPSVATVTTAARMAKMAKVPIIPAIACRVEGGYVMHILPPMTDFPNDKSGEEAHAQQMNDIIGEWVLRQPENYYWLHNRFKTVAKDE